MVKFKDFSWPLSVFQVLLQGTFYFQGLFKTVLNIQDQVLFKPVCTLWTDCPMQYTGIEKPSKIDFETRGPEGPEALT